MDINTIRKHYEKLSDNKLFELANENILNLTADGVQALKDEVSKRHLPFITLIENALLEQSELNKLVEQRCLELRLRSCPICGSSEYKLNAVRLHTILSGFSTHQRLHFGCFNCLKAEKLKAERNASVWAWLNLWQLPFNLSVISKNDKSITDLHKDVVNDHLRDFAYNQIWAEREKQRRRQSEHRLTVDVTITKSQELQ